MRHQHLAINIGANGCSFDFGKTVRSEKVHLEGEAEQPAQLKPTSPLLQLVEEEMTDARSKYLWGDGERAHLGDVVPQHVEGTTSDEAVTAMGNNELLDILKISYEFFFNKDPAGRIRRHEGGDATPISEMVAELQDMGTGGLMSQ